MITIHLFSSGGIYFFFTMISKHDNLHLTFYVWICCYTFNEKSPLIKNSILNAANMWNVHHHHLCTSIIYFQTFAIAFLLFLIFSMGSSHVHFYDGLHSVFSKLIFYYVQCMEVLVKTVHFRLCWKLKGFLIQVFSYQQLYTSCAFAMPIII